MLRPSKIIILSAGLGVAITVALAIILIIKVVPATLTEASSTPSVLEQPALAEGLFILPDSPELAKLREFFDQGKAIDWKRVHRLPDHVQFTHEAHITAGVNCATCHGDVGSMRKVEQVRDLKMGDCIDCHRANNAPTDCTTCHY